MTVINGLPAHVLFVHFLVVLAPLTAVSEILCAVWPAARRRLVWPVVVLATATMALTPLTTHAGQWLFNLRRNPSPVLREHAERGETMIYFSATLLAVALVFAAVHVLEQRSAEHRPALRAAIAIVAVAVGVSVIVQVYRIGDIGSQSVWGGEIARLTKANTG
ncbi:MAG TPA: DUF2231 domain-containing protein [Mycobacterium sp.]|jgi:hypothetical protein